MNKQQWAELNQWNQPMHFEKKGRRPFKQATVGTNWASGLFVLVVILIAAVTLGTLYATVGDVVLGQLETLQDAFDLPSTTFRN